MAPILTNIETAIATLISGMTVVGGYNYDWGSVNVIDEAQQTFPSAEIILPELTNRDRIDSGAHAQAYRQMGVFEIRVKVQLSSVATVPMFAINEPLVKVTDDLLKLFGNNISISDTCDEILFLRATRVDERAGDITRPKHIATFWEVFYAQDRLDPEVYACA